MNILLVADDFGGGAGNIIQILAKEFSEKGNSVTLYLTNLHSKRRYALDTVEIIDAAWSTMQGNWLSIQRRRMKKIREVVDKKHYDIVISFLDNNNTMVCLSLWNKKIPIIVSERSNPLEIYPKFPWNYMRSCAYRRADFIAVQFEEFRNFDKKRFVKQSVVIPNIIAASDYKKVHQDKEKISFVSLGRNHPIKQFPKMIEMFDKFLLAGGKGELHIYGAGIAADIGLKQLLTDKSLQEYVYLHDAVSNVHETLVQHDVYLMTSVQEGFPNALSEAMACGLPAIAFCCHSGIKDLIDHEKSGYCIDPKNEDAFAEAMHILAQDGLLRGKMGDQACHIAAQYNHIQVMKIWNEMIQRAQSRSEKKEIYHEKNTMSD